MAVHRDDDVAQGARQAHLVGPLQQGVRVSRVVELEHAHVSSAPTETFAAAAPQALALFQLGGL